MKHNSKEDSWFSTLLSVATPFQSKVRYVTMKVYIMALVITLSLLFLTAVVVVSRLWLKNFLRQETASLLTWKLENTENSLEYFINTKLSALKFVTSEYSQNELTNQASLHKCFLNFKKEFGSIVDMGVLNPQGKMISYVGPYKMNGKDYSEQPWFHQVLVEDAYVSDVFLGFRKIPHFAIAIKVAGKTDDDFIVVRATIDTRTLALLLGNVNLKEGEDFFLINYSGVLQTPSVNFGEVLNQYNGKIPEIKTGVNLFKSSIEDKTVTGYACIKNTPWILIALMRPKVDTAIAKFFLRELLAVFIVCILITFTLTALITHKMVNWIKEAHKERESAMLEIEHSNKLASIGRLAAGVAHEINNPLSIINQNAGLIVDLVDVFKENEESTTVQEMAAKTDRFKQIAISISDAVTRCHTITHRLLGFARRMDTSFESVNINEAIREVVGFIEKVFLYKNVSLKEEFADLLPEIMTDKGQLQQVVLNILNNALDAVPEKGTIIIATEWRENKAVISISDNGHGMTPSQMQHIFEPFYTTKEKDKGTGLGLSICYGIVKRLGGTIHVESEVGKGTCFTIELPSVSDVVNV